MKTNPSVVARLAGLCSLSVAVLCAALALPAQAQLVDIANSPLYGGKQAHPNVAVTTSVEFPTVGAAYLNIPYNRNAVFLGYFDPTKCYSYSTSNGGYFYVGGSADSNHECAGFFGGNFMNWLTMSAIDEFRYAMTGGNRVDENAANNGTIVQRAYLPDGSINGVPDFYAFGNFPRHVIGANGYLDYAPSSTLTHTVLPTASTNDGTIVWMTNCRSQLYFGSQQDGSCANPRNDYGTYNVRVLVCDSTEGPTRSDLCLQYGGTSGRYKPVGQAQVNAGRMRFASFGYLMDHDTPNYNAPCNDSGWNRCRYGGVLRSPMKYLGPTKYDANQVPFTNSQKEINADGTLQTDPEGTASTAGGSYSGFINYINKFGSSGVYKRFDPAGELYYEAIRYYQKLQPTPSAIAAIPNNDVKDFFPLTTTWSDPILATCSANYIINLSDANTWDDTYLPGYNGSPNAGYGRASSRAPEGGLDAYLWTSKIGVLESTTPSITANDVRPGLAGLQSRNTGAGNSASYLVAGAAYWANTNDIRPDLDGKQTIKTISFDVAEQSIDVHDRQLYLMGKYGGFNNTVDRAVDGTQQNPFYSTDTLNPNNPAVRSNSEWEDAPGSAYPANYLLASDPQKLITGLRAAFARINAQSGTLSGAALTSANLTVGSAGAYVATFDPARWAGSILYKSLSVVNGNLVVSPSSIWDAGALLTTRCGSVDVSATTCTDTDVSLNRRNIVTTLRVGGVRVARDFTWLNVSTDSAYATALNTSPVNGMVDSQGQSRLNYLRGYRAGEVGGTTFRPRDSALGDIINSGPVYSGPPSTNISDADYAPFYALYNNRTGAVFAGANDGMLHAFNAADGKELFAYIPNFVSRDLNDLTNPGYAHESFVDAVPSVQEVKVNGAWKTVLVAGVGAGAQGVFALDVTNPAAFGPANVLFEFSDADDADFGNVLSSPEIVKLQTGVSNGIPSYGYFAVVTGYNNRRTTFNGQPDVSVSADTNNRGVLFVLSLDRTLGTPWVQGSNYYKYYFPASNPSLANGLGPVTSYKRRDGTGAVAALYFGDLQGNLWRFNTIGNSPASWVPARGTVAAPLPLFVATTAVGNVRQPITARPEVAPGPYGTTLVAFGTGEYIGAADLSTPYAQQSEYVLVDNGTGTLITRNTDLQTRTATLSGGNVAVTGPAFVYSGANSKKGWVLDFPGTNSGERSVTKPAVQSGFLTFTTLTLSSDICGQGGGFVYQLNALTGLPFANSPNGNTGGYISTVGIPGPPRVVDLVAVGGAVQGTGEQLTKVSTTTLVSGTSGNIARSGDPADATTGIGVVYKPNRRVTWREITNYNDRH